MRSKFRLWAPALAVGLIGVTVSAPINAAVRTSVVVVQSNALTSLNPAVMSQNLVFNTDVAYATSMGFHYLNNDTLQRTPNTVLGSYSVSQNAANDFRTTWIINKGRLWSDGTPIDGIDLLLSHIISSSAYSKAAGLGDPASGLTPAFDSGSYGGVYDTTVVGEPVLSKDKMGVTLRYRYPIADWEINGPTLFPAHALVRLAEGRTVLGTAKENSAAKTTFLNAFLKKDTTLLRKMGDIWSNAYNIRTVDRSTNPHLLIVNGPYVISGAVPDTSVTLTLNPRYNSGPALNGITSLVFRVIPDGTAAAQALSNGEVDVYAGQPTADAVFLLRSLVGIKVVGSEQAVFEHADFRHASAWGSSETYSGPLAGTTNPKGRDLRTAIALAWPRQEIVDKLIRPINPSAAVLDSLTAFPKEPRYPTLVAGSGVTRFTVNSQEARTAQALELVRRYYPLATSSNPGFTVRVLWGTTSNQRRASQAQLVVAALAKAGIKVEAPGVVSWSPLLGSSSYDLAFFGWARFTEAQALPCSRFMSSGAINYLGYVNSTVDAACLRLDRALTPAQVTAEYLTIESELMRDVVSLPLFQHPGVTAIRAELNNVRPGAFSPNLLWNFWQWMY